MPDVFISYSSKDSEAARQLHTVLSMAGVTPFLAEVDLPPGVRWKEEILENLRQSQWVFFLATPHSCTSQPVSHEIGASLALRKKFIPIMWGVAPSELPDWVDDTQAVDLRDAPRIMRLIRGIGENVKSDEFVTGVLTVAFIGFVLWVLSKD
ncbi:MAG: toll/interleukin-1 receptor domain-containing protein [Verrucomicrobia bacterium]|nr:toll/interleukin-1 receptor domain-containing protein [Verrucomicrobiota bacterium]